MRTLLRRPTVWLSIGMLSVIMLLPSPAAALEVAPAGMSFTVDGGGQQAGTLTLSNDESGTQSYRIYADEEYEDWFSISPEELSLSPGQSGQVQVTVSPPAGASGEHSTFIYVAPSLPVDGLKVALGVKVRADIAVMGSNSYGWGIFDVFRNNLPLTIGVIAGIVGLIAGVVHWRKRERFYY